MTIYNAAVYAYVEGKCIKIAQRMKGKVNVYYFKVLTTTYDVIHYLKLGYKLKMCIVNHKATNHKIKQKSIANKTLMEIKLKYLKLIQKQKEKGNKEQMEGKENK